jgi:hypothetical protein
MRLLTEHFGVRDDEIALEPDREPTPGERLREALSEERLRPTLSGV